MQIDLGPIRTFQEKIVPAGTRLAGWSALVQSFGLRVPVRRTCAVSEQHIRLLMTMTASSEGVVRWG
jgi:hypothetical protein